MWGFYNVAGTVAGMGWMPFRRSGRTIRAAETVIEIGEVAHGPGGLAPSIAATITRGLSGEFGYGYGPVSRAVALSVPAVRRGVRLMTGAISSMQLERWTGNQRLPQQPLEAQPELWRPYTATMGKTVEDLILYPYAWWNVVARDMAGYPTHVARLEPEFVTVERDPVTGEPVREYVIYKGRQVPSADLIRFDGPDEGFLVHGAGAVLTAIRLELAATRYGDPDVPTGYLKNTSEYDLDAAEISSMLDEWAVARRTRTTAYVNRALDYVTTDANPEQLQLVEAREESALQISRALCLAPKYCNATSGDSMTYTNTTAERQDLIDFTLRQYIEAIEQRLSMPDRNGTPEGITVAFNMDTFLRGNPAERAALYAALIPLGVMTVDEARDAENLPPLTSEERVPAL